MGLDRRIKSDNDVNTLFNYHHQTMKQALLTVKFCKTATCEKRNRLQRR